MFALLVVASLGLTGIDMLAREEAEARLDDAVRSYVVAVGAGLDARDLERAMSTRAIALHAIYERDRMRQIDLAIDIERLRATPAADPMELHRLEDELGALRAAREACLFRRTATELQQQRAIAAARRHAP